MPERDDTTRNPGAWVIEELRKLGFVTQKDLQEAIQILRGLMDFEKLSGDKEGPDGGSKRE